MTRKNSDVDYKSVSSFYGKGQLSQIVKNRGTGDMWVKGESTLSIIPYEQNYKSFVQSFENFDDTKNQTRAQTADLNSITIKTT